MRRRLLLSYLTLTLVVLLLLEIPLGLVYADEQRRRLTASVERDALALSIRAEESIEDHDVASVQRLANTYRDRTGGRVIVVRPNGRLLVDSDTPAQLDADYSSRPEIAAALHGREAKGTRSSQSLGHDLLYFAVPIVNGRDLIGVLRVTYLTSFVDARIRRGWWVLVGIGLVVLLVVFVVSLRLARQVTVPIDRLVGAATQFGDGDLATRAPVPRGPPEIAQLTNQFNDTATQLERLVVAQQEFVADASHQLRTPLAALRLRLENLESEVAVGGDAEADVAGSLDEVARLSRLVDGLLELARAERATGTATVVDVGAVVGGRVDAWSAFADEHAVSLVESVEAHVTVRSVSGRLEQALDNLVANAIEVSPEAGTIRITGARTGNRVTITVADEGPGLTEEQRARAFDRFWRGSGAEGGAGLGLAIVRRLVEADHGRVRLDAAPSGGLAVVLDLPAA
jgi:signal transduction histidine kinase